MTPVPGHSRCIHAGEETDPVRSAERLRQLEVRMNVQDDRWAELTGPDGSLTRMLVRLSKLEVRVAIYVAVAVGLTTWGPKLLGLLVAPAARAGLP